MFLRDHTVVKTGNMWAKEHGNRNQGKSIRRSRTVEGDDEANNAVASPKRQTRMIKAKPHKSTRVIQRCDAHTYQPHCLSSDGSVCCQKCSNPASGAASGSGERLYYHKTFGETQGCGRLEKMPSTDSVARIDHPIQEEKDMDCGSQSDVPVKDRRSDDSFPNTSAVTAQQRTSVVDAAQEKCKSDGRSDFAAKPVSGGSPFSRNAGTSGGSSQLEDMLNRDGKKNPRHVAENNRRENSSSGGRHSISAALARAKATERCGTCRE